MPEKLSILQGRADGAAPLDHGHVGIRLSVPRFAQEQPQIIFWSKFPIFCVDRTKPSYAVLGPTDCQFPTAALNSHAGVSGPSSSPLSVSISYGSGLASFYSFPKNIHELSGSYCFL